MTVEVDYYAVLNIPRTATGDDIAAAVKKQMRQWRKRTEASDLSVRQEAEVRVGQIEEARVTLTDATKRRTYDNRLAREGVRQVEAPSASSGSDWVAQARHFLSIGDYHSAAYAAREATQQAGNTAESWYLRSRANAGLERYEDAWYESQQAAQIEQGNPEYQFNVGMVAEAMGRFDSAISAYQAASRLDSAPMYELAIGAVLLQTGNTRKGLEVISRVHDRVPADPTASFYLGMALLEAAEHVPGVRDSDSYVVTSAEEIDEMREYMRRAKRLDIRDNDFDAQIRNIEEYLDRMEKKTFNRNALGMFISSGAEVGCAAVAMVPVLLMIPIFMIIGGFAVLANGSASGLMLLLIGAALVYGEYRLFWQPNWKINRAIHRGR